jgi:hypothetical protein
VEILWATSAHGRVHVGWRSIAGYVAADIGAGATRARIPLKWGHDWSLRERCRRRLNDDLLRRGRGAAQTGQGRSAEGHKTQGAKCQRQNARFLELQGLNHRTGPPLCELVAPILRLDQRPWL